MKITSVQEILAGMPDLVDSPEWQAWSTLPVEVRMDCLFRAGLRPPGHPSRKPLLHPIQWWIARRQRARFAKKVVGVSHG